jgi:hypothetical protein
LITLPTALLKRSGSGIDPTMKVESLSREEVIVAAERADYHAPPRHWGETLDLAGFRGPACARTAEWRHRMVRLPF